MDKRESHKKETQCAEMPCNKTQAIIECEALCKEMLKCIDKPIAAPQKVKKERELLEGVTEYFIFWN